MTAYKTATALVVLFLCSIAQQLQAQNTWSPIADFGAGERERAVAFVIGSRAYVGTGVDSTNTCKKDFWEYDPGSNTWTQKADLPGSQRRDAIAFTIGNRGYVGTGLNGFIAWSGTKKKDFFEYNPITNTWTAKDDFEGNSGYGIYYASAFSTNTKGYVVCGKLGSSWYTDELWEYDPLADDWVKKEDFPGGVRYGVAAFSCNGKGYVGCGSDENYFLNDFWEYDPQTDVWTEKAPFPGSPRFNPAAFSINGRGYIGMGSDGGYQKDLYEYDPLTDTWMQKANLPGSERRSCVAFTIGGYGYVGIGKGPDGVKRNFFKYKPFFLFDEENDEHRLSALVLNNGQTAPVIQLQELPEAATVVVTIYSTSGQVVVSQDISGGNALDTRPFGLAHGVYVYEVRTQDAAGALEFTSGKIMIN